MSLLHNYKWLLLVSVATLSCADLFGSKEDDGGGGGDGDSTLSCASDQISCAGACVQAGTNTDCGACGVACTTGQFCSGVACQCSSGLTACETGCANAQASAQNCGVCGQACTPDQLCSAGACAPLAQGCALGLAICEGACVDTNTDAFHCGVCGTPCVAGQTCSAGVCQCASGAVCAGACTDTLTNVQHCGACDAPCATGLTCEAGVCVGGGSGGAPGAGGVPASGGTSSGGTSSGGASSGGSQQGTGGGPDPDPSCGSVKWACWPMPNPTASGLVNPASYTDQGNGTVVDNVTGLVWQDADLPSSGSQSAAIAYCDGLSLGGYDDWRLPTRIEITSVLDYSRPGWSDQAFSNTPGAFHHTGSDWILAIDQIGAGSGTDFEWAFNMSDGIVSNAYSSGNNASYRCVRSGGAGEAPDEAAIEPANHYTEVAAGEVLDNYTGLVWEAGDSDSLDHAGAISYCASLALGGNSWRLPSIRELATLVDEAEVAPSINADFFPDTKYGSRSNNWYWASDEDAQSSAAWALNFDDGFTGTNKGSDGDWNFFTAGFARCVR